MKATQTSFTIPFLLFLTIALLPLWSNAQPGREKPLKEKRVAQRPQRDNQNEHTILFGLRSPDGKVLLRLSQDENGGLLYFVQKQGRHAIRNSNIGFVYSTISSSPSLRDSLIRVLHDFTIIGVDSTQIRETWTPVLGEESSIDNKYKQAVISLKDSLGTTFNVTFRVFNEGVAFRYELVSAAKDMKNVVLLKELTEFNINKDYQVWYLPGNEDNQEFNYQSGRISQINTINQLVAAETWNNKSLDTFVVQTPFFMRTDSNLYVQIHEAGLINFPALSLELNTENFKVKASLARDAKNNAAYLDVPFTSPWRVIQLSEDPVDLLASRMMLNLNDPAKITNTSWIKPAKVIGYQPFIPYNAQAAPLKVDQLLDVNAYKQRVDFASANGFDAVLVQNWNQGWNAGVSLTQRSETNFSTPRSDFNVANLSKYASSKKVNLVFQFETFGNSTVLENQLGSAFGFLSGNASKHMQLGYKGPMVPLGESHTSQFAVQHYQRLIGQTSNAGIMLSMQQTVHPTGLQRSWPNLITFGNVLDYSYVGTKNPPSPEHETYLPFTRGMSGPINYAAGYFHFTLPNGQKVQSTLARQLALYVVMYSPWQMMTDSPENYQKHSDMFQFLRDVPCDWMQSLYLTALPGEAIVIARQAKSNKQWFIGGITNNEARTENISLSFLDTGKTYEAIIYADGDSAHYLNNPTEHQIKREKVKSTDTITLKMAAGGGFAIQFVPQ